MCKIAIRKYNNVFCKVEADQSLLTEVDHLLRFYDPTCIYDERFKRGLWDGYVNLFNPIDNLALQGNIVQIRDYCRDKGYEFESDISFLQKKDVDIDYVKEQLNDIPISALNKNTGEFSAITPFPYQLNAIRISESLSRAVYLSPTSSGKSLVIYMLTRRLLRTIDPSKKVLIFVPKVNLAGQLEDNFDEYSHNDDKFCAESNIHKIYSGQSKHTDKRVVISTFQSLYKMDKEYFDQFGAVIVDECHRAKSSTFVRILETMDCMYRYGFTGTLDGKEHNEYLIRGLIGPIQKLVTIQELRELGIVPDVNIQAYNLYHTTKAPLSSWQRQKEYIEVSERRARAVAKISKPDDGENVLVLFNTISHGQLMAEECRKLYGNDKVVLLKSDVKVDDRAKLINDIENSENMIVFATFSLFSEGVSINKLHKVVFASSTKSVIQVLQSIGRSLRRHETKEYAKLIDITDTFEHSTFDYLYRQFEERVKHYKSQGYSYKIKKIS